MSDGKAKARHHRISKRSKRDDADEDLNDVKLDIEPTLELEDIFLPFEEKKRKRAREGSSEATDFIDDEDGLDEDEELVEPETVDESSYDSKNTNPRKKIKKDSGLDSLPKWMKTGQVLENWKTIDIDELVRWVHPDLRKQVKTSLGFSSLFPVQVASLPALVQANGRQVSHMSTISLGIDSSSLASGNGLEDEGTTWKTDLSFSRSSASEENELGLERNQKILEKISHVKPSSTSGKRGRARDLMISAPTGSGKTLAFVLPIVQQLKNRIVPRTRVLALAPSRDLALQILSVFEQVAHLHNEEHKAMKDDGDEDKATNYVPLRVVSCLGQRSLKAEQTFLLHPYPADILVATPGRLVDHLNETAGFDLQHLQFLIIDEADRLLNNSYQDWVFRVLSAARPSLSFLNSQLQTFVDSESSSSHGNEGTALSFSDLLSVLRIPSPVLAGGKATKGTTTEKKRESTCDLFSLQPVTPLTTPLRKCCFSATLTRNPAKIALLQLQAPLYFHDSENGRYKIPDLLEEHSVVCPKAGSEKPLVLLHLLSTLQLERVLCFTSTTEATHRLFLLLRTMGVSNIAEFSRNLPQFTRTRILDEFREGKLQMIICSDAISRGIDLEEVSAVVCYDVPPFVKTYIHRVGRTARAGRSGKSFSILRPEEISHFEKMRKKAGDLEKCKPISVSSSDINALVPAFLEALPKLKLQIDQEKFASH